MAGDTSEDAARAAGISSTNARRAMRQAGGVAPAHLLKPLSSRFLSPMDRAAIMVADRQGQSVRAIAAMLGRAPSTISRELRRNRAHWMPRYHAGQAQLRAEARARRPQPSKLALNPTLRKFVQERLDRRWSPEQISQKLRESYPDDESMRVSTETIYRTIYKQAGGTLRRNLTPKLRTGRDIRRPRRQQQTAPSRVFHSIPGLRSITERPAEVLDRQIPGHWEGDLIVGPDTRSHIGTLVERTSRYCILVHLPTSKTAEAVAEAVTRALRTVPLELRKTLTWDRGTEMRHHEQISLATGTDIYFCDPRSPWQRGSNENTNGLLRQYFPRGTDLSRHSAADLEFVARELNARPRRTLGWQSPAEVFDRLILEVKHPQSVATMP